MEEKQAFPAEAVIFFKKSHYTQRVNYINFGQYGTTYLGKNKEKKKHAMSLTIGSTVLSPT